MISRGEFFFFIKIKEKRKSQMFSKRKQTRNRNIFSKVVDLFSKPGTILGGNSLNFLYDASIDQMHY